MCGGRFRAILGSESDATHCGVDHRCGTGVIGPVWTLIQPPIARRARTDIEAVA
jgi:hypothetical protein